jgi:hypothetical protein
VGFDWPTGGKSHQSQDVASGAGRLRRFKTRPRRKADLASPDIRPASFAYALADFAAFSARSSHVTSNVYAVRAFPCASSNARWTFNGSGEDGATFLIDVRALFRAVCGGVSSGGDLRPSPSTSWPLRAFSSTRGGPACPTGIDTSQSNAPDSRTDQGRGSPMDCVDSGSQRKRSACRQAVSGSLRTREARSSRWSSGWSRRNPASMD